MGDMDEKVFARGKIFELVHLPQMDGRVFEVARRAPGARIIIADMTKREVLLTREFRRELNDYDYRLPGGKVFDTLEEYEAHRTKQGDIAEAATTKAKQEAAEEAGVILDNLKLFRKSSLGATVEWDLYVFESTKWHHNPSGQNLQEDERDGIEVAMYPYEKVKLMILDGEMQEDRIALVLLQWLKRQD